jgi:CheY-like chemotaxis protein
MNVHNNAERGDHVDTRLPRFRREGLVLVAEDDPAMRELMVQVLRSDGHEVVGVASGERMLEVLIERDVAFWPENGFDIIVTDHRMPNGDGLDVVELLRRSGCTIPILLISAFADSRMRTRADELETMLMSKPFPLPAFRSAVDVLLSLTPPRSWRRGSDAR